VKTRAWGSFSSGEGRQGLGQPGTKRPDRGTDAQRGGGLRCAVLTGSGQHGGHKQGRGAADR
jgi:hypothetical protein